MTIEAGGDAPTCSHPLDAAVLADYWVVALPESEEAEVEKHLLVCDQCGARLRGVVALAEGIRSLAREGCLRLVVSDVFLECARENGLRVREYAPPSGGSVQCTVTPEDDLLVGRLAVGLAGAALVDLSFCDERGVEQVRLSDIPVRRGAEDVVFQESITALKAAPTSTMIARLLTVDEGGRERLLGEYTFNHTRTMPGPAA